jgi:hypothetical protein
MQVSKPVARAGGRSIAIAQNADNAIVVAMIPRMASLQPGGRLNDYRGELDCRLLKSPGRLVARGRG